MSLPVPAVAEIQGLYGPFTFSEKLLQMIWLRGDFASAGAETLDGRHVTITHAGKWNLLGGPDFKGARLRFGAGPEITGDVELHLRATDWAAHAHARDKAYDGVVLHVVLFPPERGHITRGVGGKEIPVLALLPLLHHDLEEFAADEAVESLSGRSAIRIPEELTSLNEEELAALLATHATARWRQKVHFARLRIERLGWTKACHHTALEILGYRFNRVPMLRIAGRWPLEEWARAAVAPDREFEANADFWSLQGVRPANHPRTRLRQYAAWVNAVPDWPTRLLVECASLSAPSGSKAPFGPGEVPRDATKNFRHAIGLTGLRERLAQSLCGNAIGGTRFDNLMCDGFLPLIAGTLPESREATAGEKALRDVWYHWFAGDIPPFILRGLRELDVFRAPSRPACHGAAQGLLGWQLEREAHP